MPEEFQYQQIHIDAARNATDDFNPFHDPKKWQRVRGNPFRTTIALGFQLECLIEYLLTVYRIDRGEDRRIREAGLRFSNYQLTFADSIRPGESFAVDIRPTSDKIEQTGQLVNRIAVRKGRSLAMLGYQRESREPLHLADFSAEGLDDLDGAEDRGYLASGRYFLKRKFLNTGNAKNFLSGSLAHQHFYFDELEDRVSFPAMYPVALLSCALLEKERQAGYDFEGNPLVFTAHNISVDRELQSGLHSNDRLNMLVCGPEAVSEGQGLRGSGVEQRRYSCFGLVRSDEVLYRAEVRMAALEALLNQAKAVP